MSPADAPRTDAASGDVGRSDAGARDAAAERGHDLPGADATAQDAAPESPAALCRPTSDGPHWLEETEVLRARLRCATGLGAEGRDFVLGNLPAGARYEPETTTLAFTPALDQANVYTVTVAHLPSGERAEIRIGVADKFDAPGNDPTVDPMTYTEEHGLPVMHLATAPNINRDFYTPATIIYRGHRYTAEAQYRGAASFYYPKKNFTLRFAKEDKFNEPALGDAFLARRKITLITTFDDNSALRARLAFTLWKRMDPRNVALTTYSGVVYLNGRYHGIYTIADKVDGNLMQRHGHAEDGNMFMSITHDGNFAAWVFNEGNPHDEAKLKTSLAAGYEQKEGLPPHGTPTSFDDIAALTDFVIRAAPASFASQLAARVDLGDYVNWLIHATAIQAFDGLGKNAFHYHDLVGQGAAARWRYIPWDFNDSLGQRWNTGRVPTMVDPKDIVYQHPGGTAYTNRNYLWRRMWNDPTLGPMIRSRYAEVLRTTLKRDDVLALWDAMVAETRASARRDERLWGAMHRSYYKRLDPTTYEQELAYVRRFIEDRWNFLAARY